MQVMLSLVSCSLLAGVKGGGGWVGVGELLAWRGVSHRMLYGCIQRSPQTFYHRIV